MSTIERPTKRGGVRSFDESYNKGFKTAWASEVDADIDNLVTAWNTQVPDAIFNLAGIPPSGIASGDLTGTYPAPTVASGVITRAKTAADLWLVPVPTAGDLGKLLTIQTGPILAWTLGGGGPPTGPAGGTVLAGTYPNPTGSVSSLTFTSSSQQILPNARVIMVLSTVTNQWFNSIPTIPDGINGQLLTIVNSGAWDGHTFGLQGESLLPGSNLRLDNASSGALNIDPGSSVQLVFVANTGWWHQIGSMITNKMNP